MQGGLKKNVLITAKRRVSWSSERTRNLGVVGGKSDKKNYCVTVNADNEYSLYFLRLSQILSSLRKTRESILHWFLRHNSTLFSECWNWNFISARQWEKEWERQWFFSYFKVLIPVLVWRNLGNHGKRYLELSIPGTSRLLSKHIFPIPKYVRCSLYFRTEIWIDFNVRLTIWDNERGFKITSSSAIITIKSKTIGYFVCDFLVPHNFPVAILYTHCGYWNFPII